MDRKIKKSTIRSPIVTALLVSILLLTQVSCSQAILQNPKIPKPAAPNLDIIIIENDLHCEIKTDESLCRIASNFSKLMKYICKLEAAPFWEDGSDNICPLDLDSFLYKQKKEKDIILSKF